MGGLTKFQKLLNENFDKIEFEGVGELDGVLSLYFYAPRVLLEDNYANAFGATIRVDCDISKRKLMDRSNVMISPNRHTPDGGLEDYDWTDIYPTAYQLRWLVSRGVGAMWRKTLKEKRR